MYEKKNEFSQQTLILDEINAWLLNAVHYNINENCAIKKKQSFLMSVLEDID